MTDIVNAKGEPLTVTLLAYIAGFFDAEGSIFARKHNGTNNYNIVCTFSQNDIAVLRMIQSYFGGIEYPSRRSFMLTFSPIKADRLLRALIPFLIIKKEQAQIAIDYRKTCENRFRGSMSKDDKEKMLKVVDNLKVIKTQQLPSSLLGALHLDSSIIPYVAGFFDGEGCININRQHGYKNPVHTLSCSIGQRITLVLDYLKLIFGGIIQLREGKTNVGTITYWSNWYISSWKARDFLNKVKPYLIVKKMEAELAIEFQNRHIDYKLTPQEVSMRDSQKQLMHDLKHSNIVQVGMSI